jgi:hypothetical protein
MKSFTRALCAACAAFAFEVQAASLDHSVEAFANATVQPGGIRAGGSGINFFDIEGVDNGSFASYGVARFDLAAASSLAALAAIRGM